MNGHSCRTAFELCELPSRIQPRIRADPRPATPGLVPMRATVRSWRARACRSVCEGLSNVGHFVVPGPTVEVDWWLASVGVGAVLAVERHDGCGVGKFPKC